ncbi:Blue copper protein 1b, partial [Linum grandiflorum]
MAKRFLMLAVLAMVTIMPAANVVMAAEYIVGDSQGWSTSVGNYSKWAAGKDFVVGDILVFNYDKTKDSVIIVKSGPEFQNCIPLGSNILNSGNDKIVLDTVGKWWFISGVASHCAESNQKLVVTAEGVPSPGSPPGLKTPPGSDPNSAYGPTNGMLYWVNGLVAASVSVALAVML